MSAAAVRSIVSWRLDRPTPCAGCGEKVYPHETYVQLGDRAYHEACAPAKTGLGPVEDPAEIARAHREASEAGIRSDVRLALDTDSGDFHREALRRLRETVHETYTIVKDTTLPFVGEWKRFTFDDADLLERVAIAESRNRGVNCATSWTHINVFHQGSKRCHDVYPFTCKAPSCFACYRRARRGELNRHEDLLRQLIGEGRLYVLEIPCLLEVRSDRLRRRMNAVRDAVRRRRRKANMIVLVDPDRVLVVGDESIVEGLGRFNAPVKVPSWKALGSLCVPLVPLQVLLDDDRLLREWKGVQDADGLVKIYTAERGHRKTARPYGQFYNTRKRDPNVLKVRDEKTGKVKTIRLCPVCRDPAERVAVVHRAWGEWCEDCPTPPLRGPAAYDARMRVFVNAGSGPPH